MIVDVAPLRALEARGYLRSYRHPTEPLTGWNYTARTQFERLWTPETMLCRGLIVDDDGNIVARPLSKFFNLEEHDGPLPDEPSVVHEKLDGSLFVVARYGDAIIAGTRGSFVGRQAILGRELLWDAYRVEEWRSRIVPGLTYCFELIEPSNRIVVDYGDRRELVLLAVIDNATGRDVEWEDGALPMPRVAVYPGLGADPAALITHERPNAEGFVLHFTGPSNLRLKVKFAEYKRLHRILTGISERDVWEALRQDNAAELGRLLERVPDEFYRWVQSIMGRLRDAYDAIERRCRDDFARITARIPPARDAAVRKAFAAEAVACDYPPVLFALWDGKPYGDIIWRAVRPEAGRPFREDES